ncbi:hypothetical protein [Corynebacterium halotolerans]|uniref:hypothetical protein n=1 Tax=Corynebacterium halotolerans TaxID=225326 RepID=UPI00034AB5CF|nr:hypothetical protein [Corynebacterium halotolerans]
MAGQKKKLSATASAALAFTALFTASLGQSGARGPDGEADMVAAPTSSGEAGDRHRP